MHRFVSILVVTLALMAGSAGAASATTGNGAPHDPRIEVVVGSEWTSFCTNRANVLAEVRYDDIVHAIVYREVVSAEACAGAADQQPPAVRALNVETNLQYSPLEGPAMIAFDRGREFHLGVCTRVPDRLAIISTVAGMAIVTVVSVPPTVCPPPTRA